MDEAVVWVKISHGLGWTGDRESVVREDVLVLDDEGEEKAPVKAKTMEEELEADIAGMKEKKEKKVYRFSEFYDWLWLGGRI